MNLARGRLICDDGSLAVVFSGKVPLTGKTIAEHPGLERFDRQVIIGVRPPA